MAEKERCACGEAEWRAGMGWGGGHSDTSCMVGELWMNRSEFQLTPRQHVERLSQIIRQREEAVGRVEQAEQAHARLLEAMAKVQDDRDAWRAAFKATCRALALDTGGE